MTLYFVLVQPRRGHFPNPFSGRTLGAIQAPLWALCSPAQEGNINVDRHQG
jgi:hypothetical protein